MSKIKCHFCRKTFLRERSRANYRRRKGLLQFCSHSCSSKYTQKVNPQIPPKRAFTKIKIICDNCGKEFLRWPSFIKKHKELNYRYVFCSMHCRITFKRSKTGFHSTYLDPSLRRKILKLDNHTCTQCKQKFKAKDLQIDHDVPVSCGGDNDIDNLRVICHKCHVKKRPEDRRLLHEMRELNCFYIDPYTEKVINF